MKDTRRMKRMRRNHKKKLPALNLTSLMDVFTILVFFLLVNSSNSEVLESFHLLRGKLLRGEIPMARLEQSSERIAEGKSRFLQGPPEVSLDRVREYFERDA